MFRILIGTFVIVGTLVVGYIALRVCFKATPIPGTHEREAIETKERIEVEEDPFNPSSRNH